MTIATPAVRPGVPHFSSGPCAKRPGWSLQALTDAVLGRSHRSKAGKAKLKRAIDLTREVLQVPADYRIGIVPASDTGAVEMALWSLLGPRPVTMLAWESFGEGWVSDVAKELKLKDVTVLKAGYGELPDLAKVDPAQRRRLHLERHDLRRARAQRRLDRRRPRRPRHLRRDLGRVRAAARLAKARCRDLLLAEGAGRRGGARHADPVAARGRAARKLHAAVAAAENLPHDQGRQADRRHLPGRDHQHAVDAVRGGLSRRARLGEVDRRAARRCSARADANAKVIADWVARTPWIDFLARDPAQRSNTSVCLKVVDPAVSRARRRRAGRFRQRHRRRAREGGRRLRHRRLSRRATGLAHLVRLDRRAHRRRGAHALARLGLRQSQGRCQGRDLPRAGHPNASRRSNASADHPLSHLQDGNRTSHGPQSSHLRRTFARRRRRSSRIAASRSTSSPISARTRTSLPRRSTASTGSQSAPRPRSPRRCWKRRKA